MFCLQTRESAILFHSRHILKRCSSKTVIGLSLKSKAKKEIYSWRLQQHCYLSCCHQYIWKLLSEYSTSWLYITTYSKISSTQIYRQQFWAKNMSKAATQMIKISRTLRKKRHFCNCNILKKCFSLFNLKKAREQKDCVIKYDENNILKKNKSSLRWLHKFI